MEDGWNQESTAISHSQAALLLQLLCNIQCYMKFCSCFYSTLLLLLQIKHFQLAQKILQYLLPSNVIMIYTTS